MKNVPHYIRLLKQSNPQIRAIAVSALGDIGDKSAVPDSIETLKDSDAGVRLQSVIALGRLADVSAVPALIEALNDSDYYVRDNAAWSLGVIGDTSAIPALIETLRNAHGEAHNNSVYALMKLGVPAIPALTECFLNNIDARHRCTSVLLGMGEVGVPVFIKAFSKGDLSLCSYAVQALVASGSVAVPALLEALKSEAIHLPRVD